MDQNIELSVDLYQYYGVMRVLEQIAEVPKYLGISHVHLESSYEWRDGLLFQVFSFSDSSPILQFSIFVLH